EKRGREQFYKLDPGPLLLVAGWIMRYEQFWRKKLEKLGHVLDELK
ncbi:MAG: transcriptional regulator, partial [Deltaproteobacteria bacterium]|nr:transcriptional regulator [Deltaproteobacteria bacterium]